MIGGHGDVVMMFGVVADEGAAAFFFGMLQDGFAPGGGEKDGVAFLSLVFGQQDAPGIPAVLRGEG